MRAATQRREVGRMPNAAHLECTGSARLMDNQNTRRRDLANGGVRGEASPHGTLRHGSQGCQLELGY